MLPAEALEARSGGWGGSRENKAGLGYPGAPMPKEEGETLEKKKHIPEDKDLGVDHFN